MAGSAVGEGGRGSCGGGGVPPALHAQQRAWGPGQTGQPSERSGRCMDGAHRDWQEPGCGRGGLSKAATAGRRAETRWSPSRPPARLSRQLSHCGSLMPSGAGSRTVGSQAGCEHSGGEGARGGERSLSAPLRVPLPRAPSSGGRAGADWTTCRPRPQRTRQGVTCRLACSCGDSLSRETATSGGGWCCGALCVPLGGTQTLCVGGLAQGRRLLREGWWGDVVDAPISPPQRSWEWEPLPGSQRPRHAHGAPKCGGPGALLAGTLQQGADWEGRGPTWLTQLAWLRVLTARM